MCASNDLQPPEPDRVRLVTNSPSEVVEATSAIGGGLVGQAIAAVTGDPLVGSAGGAAFVRILRRVGFEVEQHVHGRRQRRAAEAVRTIGDEVHDQELAGHQPRADGFFDASSARHGSQAEELLEGVLTEAADAWEQRKVPYIARIFSTTAFDQRVTHSQASFLLRLSGRITYQQIVLLAFWHCAQDPSRRYEHEIASTAYLVSEGQAGRPTPTIATEMDELGALNLLGIAHQSDVVRVGATFGSAAGFGEVDLNTIRLTPLGEMAYRLMRLEEVPEPDLDEVLVELRGGVDHA